MSEVKLGLWIVLTHLVQALQQGCIQSLPKFVDQGNYSPTLLLGIQALVPAYQFSCYGRVRRWGMATKRKGKHSIDFQVWRATTSRYGTQVYSLVGCNRFDVEPPTDRALFYVNVPVMDQITVQAGDMIGFYLLNNISIDNNFSIQYKPYTNNVTLHFVMTEEPLTVIKETTLSVQMSKTAPVITVDIDFLISTVNLPKATLSFKVTSNLGPTHSQTSTVVHLHRSIDYIHTTNDPTQSTLIEETNPTNIPTAAILGVALGILIIAMLLAVIGIMIACKKAGSSGIDDGRLHQMHITHGSNQSRVKGVCARNLKETCITEFLIKENPAYSQCTILETSSSDQAHEYETPVVNKTEETPLVTTQNYDVPRQFNRYEHHDYEEVLN